MLFFHEETFNIITGSNVADTLPSGGTGDGGDDILYELGTDNDILLGGSGNDTLFGQSGTNSLRGGEGNDSLYGGIGNDQYIFAFTGDGNDIIDELGGTGSDRIQIGDGTFSSLTFERIDSASSLDSDTTIDDLLISYNGQRIEVLNQYGGSEIELVTFGSSSFGGYALSGDYTLNLDTSSPLDGGNSSNDVIASDSDLATPDTLDGRNGNDLLFGNGGDDVLVGGNGRSSTDWRRRKR